MGWTKGLSILQRRKKISRKTVRKAIHVTAGPMMAITWPLYTMGWSARVTAAIVPLVFAVRLQQSTQGDALCESISRSGDQCESREGPFWYCVSIMSTILVFWRKSRVTYAVVGALCFGDGMAEVVGASFNGPLWPIPKSISMKKKSIVGSTAFIIASASSIAAFMQFAQATGACDEKLSWARIFMISAVSAATEIAPLEDNVTVPLSAMVLAMM
eukprot:IDg18208t1